MRWTASHYEKRIREGIHDYIRQHGCYPPSITISTFFIQQKYLVPNAKEYEFNGVKTSYIFGVPIVFMPIDQEKCEVK